MSIYIYIYIYIYIDILRKLYKKREREGEQKNLSPRGGLTKIRMSVFVEIVCVILSIFFHFFEMFF